LCLCGIFLNFECKFWNINPIPKIPSKFLKMGFQEDFFGKSQLPKIMIFRSFLRGSSQEPISPLRTGYPLAVLAPFAALLSCFRLSLDTLTYILRLRKSQRRRQRHRQQRQQQRQRRLRAVHCCSLAHTCCPSVLLKFI